MPKPTNLGELLRVYRVLHRLTVRDLAPPLKISHATLSRIERGHSMDTDTFLKVITWLLSHQ